MTKLDVAPTATGAETPGPRGWPVVGVLPQLRRDPLATLFDIWDRYGDIARLPLAPGIRVHMVSAPEYVEEILKNSAADYPKDARFYLQLKLLVGESLLVSDGEAWKSKHDIVRPAFGGRALQGFHPEILGTVRRQLDTWSIADDAPIDIAAEMTALALVIGAKTFFGTETRSRVDVISNEGVAVQHFIQRRLLSPVRLPLSVPTPSARRFLRARRILDQVVYGLIDERKGDTQPRNDFLGIMTDARSDGQPALTKQQIKDEVMALLFASHETTATAMTWTLYLLSLHPHVFERMVAEVDEVVGDGQVDLRHLPRLPYVTAVFHEAMRLYPPVWALTRQATTDTTLGGYRIRTGDYVVISPYLVHRHPQHWTHPEVFSPERFLGKPEFAPAAYIPFGVGQRRCIGAGFTVMEARIVLATILQRFQLELVRGGVVQPKPVMSLRPPGPIRMTVRPRGRTVDMAAPE